MCIRDRVAPEHCAPNALKYMGKPPVEVFDKFSKRFYEMCIRDRARPPAGVFFAAARCCII